MRRAAFALLLVAASAEARRPRPPEPPPKPDDFVDITRVIPDAVIDMRYATADNFTGDVLYPIARCKLRRTVAERLAVAAKALREQHRRLLIWDCYRPLAIQRALWAKVHDPKYVADPKFGSKHNHGAAVDVGLVAEDGSPVPLPTKFDEFSIAAHRDHALASGHGAAEGRRLEKAMTDAGFVGLSTEWWHFDAPDWAHFPLSDEPL
ncbi:MAG TPA: M15 family metallopeptidase [Kofleriaceae bacterium]|jgi:D-alanyl-D-alanine dipeptidase